MFLNPFIYPWRPRKESEPPRKPNPLAKTEPCKHCWVPYAKGKTIRVELCTACRVMVVSAGDEAILIETGWTTKGPQ